MLIYRFDFSESRKSFQFKNHHKIGSIITQTNRFKEWDIDEIVLIDITHQTVTDKKKYINFVHISVGYKGPILAKHLIEEKVSSIINTDKKGNSWWIFNSIFKSFNSPIYVLTCDNVTNIDFKKLEKDYYKKGQPLCMLIPTKPIKGLAGDFIFKKKNIVKKLSRTQKSDIYCTGIQILNPKKINDKIKPTDDFNILWKKLIKIRQLYVSDVMPKKWYTVDNLDNLKKLKKIFK